MYVYCTFSSKCGVNNIELNQSAGNAANMDEDILMDDDLNNELQGVMDDFSRPSLRASSTFSFNAQDVRYFHICNVQWINFLN